MRDLKGRFIKGFSYNKGIKRSEETKRKLSEAMRKNPARYWLGKKRPEIQTWMSKHNFKKGSAPPNKGIKGYTNAGTFKTGHVGMSGKSNPSYKHGKSKEMKGFYQKRRKLRKTSNGKSHTAQEWLSMKKVYQFMCLCCGRTEPEITLTEDHIIPLSKGGYDSIDNIQPLCMRCNSVKHINTVDFRSAYNNGSYINHSVI